MTIKDLAAASGYSVGTVSRVLNGHSNVSETAHSIVMKVVEEYGFELNANAKYLKQQSGTCILVIVKGTSNELFATLVEQLQLLATDTRYPLIIDYIDEDANEVVRAIQLSKERKPLGILFLGGSNRHFRASFAQTKVPSVVVTNDAHALDFPRLSSVSTDDQVGAYQAVEHLIRAGHNNIAVLGGDRTRSDTSFLRYQGCVDAFQHNRLHFDDSWYRTGRYSFASGYRNMTDLLQIHPETTAVFAMADVIAIGAIRALWDQGKRVPYDVSVIGYDGLRISDYFLPKLSTIAQQVEALAQRSFTLLLDCVEGGLPARHETVPFSLKIGESVRSLSSLPK